MGKKKFEEVEYDPFEQESRRNLARRLTAPAVEATGRSEARPADVSGSTHNQAASLTDPRREVSRSFRDVAPIAPSRGRPMPLKSRTFKCASATQDKELDSFLLRLAEASGTSVPFQVVTRAAIAATMRSEEQILELIRRRPPMRRPANVSATEYAQFEQYWMEVVAEALRKLRPHQ
jgi:hypothetical protein